MEIQVRVDGNCGTIVLQHKERRNALSRSMIGDMMEAFDDLHQQPSVRAVIVTGQGDTFTSGTDLYELQATREAGQAEMAWFEDAERHQKLLTKILHFPKPVIASVNGPALGIGVGIICACDIVLAAADATFGFPESKRGLSPGISVPIVAHRLGTGAANQLLLHSDKIDAEAAYRLGLVQEIVAFDLLWARAVQLAGEIAQSSPVSVAMTKRILNETVGEQLTTQLSAAAAVMATARTTAHAVEGVTAFLEKRPPNWNAAYEPPPLAAEE